MEGGTKVARRHVTIVNAYGLHMRPSNKFVKLASGYKSEILVFFEGKKANGKSILEMTMLAAEKGAVLELEARGEDADEAVDALAELVAAGFHMEEERD